MQMVVHSVADQVTSLQLAERTYNKLQIKYQEAIDSGKPEDVQGRLAQQVKDARVQPTTKGVCVELMVIGVGTKHGKRTN